MEPLILVCCRYDLVWTPAPLPLAVKGGDKFDMGKVWWRRGSGRGGTGVHRTGLCIGQACAGWRGREQWTCAQGCGWAGAGMKVLGGGQGEVVIGGPEAGAQGLGLVRRAWGGEGEASLQGPARPSSPIALHPSLFPRPITWPPCPSSLPLLCVQGHAEFVLALNLAGYDVLVSMGCGMGHLLEVGGVSLSGRGFT